MQNMHQLYTLPIHITLLRGPYLLPPVLEVGEEISKGNKLQGQCKWQCSGDTAHHLDHMAALSSGHLLHYGNLFEKILHFLLYWTSCSHRIYSVCVRMESGAHGILQSIQVDYTVCIFHETVKIFNIHIVHLSGVWWPLCMVVSHPLFVLLCIP